MRKHVFLLLLQTLPSHTSQRFNYLFGNHLSQSYRYAAQLAQNAIYITLGIISVIHNGLISVISLVKKMVLATILTINDRDFKSEVRSRLYTAN